MEEDRKSVRDNNPLAKDDYSNSENSQDLFPNTGLADSIDTNQFLEETSAEMVGPRVNYDRNSLKTDDDRTSGGTLVGAISLIISIISLFMMPFILGIIGIIGGFISRNRGAKTLGSWAIGIGAVSIIVGIFIAPFF